MSTPPMYDGDMKQDEIASNFDVGNAGKDGASGRPLWAKNSKKNPFPCHMTYVI